MSFLSFVGVTALIIAAGVGIVVAGIWWWARRNDPQRRR